MQSEMQTLKVISLYISKTPGLPTVSTAEIQLRPNYGIIGDTHTGEMRTRSNGEVVPNLRHFTAVSPQELGEVAEELGVPYLDPSLLSANICFAGVKKLTETLVPGTLLFNAEGRAVLEVKGVVEPCFSMGQRIAAHYPQLAVEAQLFPKYANGRRGIHGIALEETTIKLYDTFSVVLPSR